MGEDCLYLNVWRPIGTSSDAKLPVLAFIYVSKHPNLHTNDFELIERRRADNGPLGLQMSLGRK